MNMNTEAQATPTEQGPGRPNGRREDRRPNRADQRADRRYNRSAAEVMQHLPVGWSATIIEPDAEGNKDARTRLRVLVFENPDKGFKLLPFMTVRHARRMRTDEASVETMDDMDILPNNPLEQAMPAILFDHGKVMEEFCVLLADYAKKQADLPPPSKRPLTQRPFAEGLQRIARAHNRERERQQQAQPYQAPSQQQQPQRQDNKKSRRGRNKHASVVLLMPLL